MKLKLLVFLFLLALVNANAQSLTGIWRGYFNSGYGSFKQHYKYEVQINQLDNKSAQKAVQGVTYSYHSTVFYGKATLQGIYDAGGKSITLRETKLVELKISDNSQPCLMTCYLDYRKEGSTEILEGTFTSVVEKTKADCGSGYVYLERVDESDFYKEDFLLKKPSSKTPPVAKTTPPANNQAEKKTTTVPPPAPSNKTTAQTKPPATKNNTNSVPPAAGKKSTGDNTSKNTKPRGNPVTKNPSADTVAKTKPVAPPTVVNPAPDQLVKKSVVVPNVIKERENPLVRKIVTGSPDILIQIYDNGEIDGDTITVYDNNEIIADSKRLTGKAITLNIKADIINSHHEFVMVADNLGSIPPNTALMVITTDGKRYELFISSDETKNAKVIIEYKPPSKDSK